MVFRMNSMLGNPLQFKVLNNFFQIQIVQQEYILYKICRVENYIIFIGVVEIVLIQVKRVLIQYLEELSNIGYMNLFHLRNLYYVLNISCIMKHMHNLVGLI